MRNHLYSIAVSNCSSSRIININRSLPLKYYNAYLAASLPAILEVGADRLIASDSGSGEIYFRTDATTANALRKWFQRRFKGRAKFARQIIPTKFCPIPLPVVGTMGVHEMMEVTA